MISFSDHEPTSFPFSWEAVPQGSFRAESRSGLYAPFQGGQKQEEGNLDLGGRGALVPVIRFSAWHGGIHHWLLDLEGGPPGGEAGS